MHAVAVGSADVVHGQCDVAGDKLARHVRGHISVTLVGGSVSFMTIALAASRCCLSVEIVL